MILIDAWCWRLKSELSQMVNSYVNKYTPSFNRLKKYKIQQKLKCNKDIVITHSGKGNGLVILNRDEYIKSMTELISDQKKFRKLKEYPTLKRERALQWTLREINKKNIFSDIEYSNLYPKGTKPARLYGTPKIHKAFLRGSPPPFRPIVSSIGTYIPSEYSTKDSFTFIEEIKSVSVTDKFLISFDVTSLFTNITSSEEIDIAINLIFENSTDIKFTKREVRKIFRIATSQTHFTFNGRIFDQIDGVTMGSPLAPVLANLFMGFHEQNWIEKATNVKPMFYKRYLDDIFAVFKSESDADAFFIY